MIKQKLNKFLKLGKLYNVTLLTFTLFSTGRRFALCWFIAALLMSLRQNETSTMLCLYDKLLVCHREKLFNVVKTVLLMSFVSNETCLVLKCLINFCGYQCYVKPLLFNVNKSELYERM